MPGSKRAHCLAGRDVTGIASSHRINESLLTSMKKLMSKYIASTVSRATGAPNTVEVAGIDGYFLQVKGRSGYWAGIFHDGIFAVGKAGNGRLSGLKTPSINNRFQPETGTPPIRWVVISDPATTRTMGTAVTGTGAPSRAATALEIGACSAAD
jgi:hypothetical protein